MFSACSSVSDWNHKWPSEHDVIRTRMLKSNKSTTPTDWNNAAGGHDVAYGSCCPGCGLTTAIDAKSYSGKIGVGDFVVSSSESWSLTVAPFCVYMIAIPKTVSTPNVVGVHDG